MKLVLLGGGGHASDVLGAIEEVNKQAEISGEEQIDVIGIVDDNPIDDARFEDRGVKRIGTFADLEGLEASHYISCIGYPKGREAVAAKAESAGLIAAPPVIHPRAFLATGAKIGDGSVFLAGVCASPMCQFGKHTYISHGALVGHDCVLGDYASLMPGASVSGDTTLEHGVMIGASATVLQGLTVGAHSTIGAGAVAVKDIPAGVTAIGIPAKF